jgi:TetR/AcrR family transcriptional regulator, mexJK operon transcriptional repressor
MGHSLSHFVGEGLRCRAACQLKLRAAPCRTKLVGNIVARAHGSETEDKRREHILEVAQDAFLANGYADTTIDNIAAAAKISKQTLYHYFHDKADLFEAVIVRDMERFRNLPDLTRDRRDPEEVLFEVARWIYDNNVSRQTLAMHRVLAGAAGSFGELVERHYDFRSAISKSWITTYIRSLADSGVVEVADPARAATRFALMASEGSNTIMWYPPADMEERDRVARLTVSTFIRGLKRKSAATTAPA